MRTKSFTIDDILSVMSDTLVSRRHIGGVYDVLNHMTGESLMTHQLPRASREAEPSLREQFPDLAAIEIPDWSAFSANEVRAAVFAWVDEQIAQHGETREVRALDPDDHTRIDPITELSMLRPDAEVIVVTTTPEGDPR